MAMTWKLRENQAYRYGRIWELICGRWCCTPPVPASDKWVASEKTTIPDFMASWEEGNETFQQRMFIEQETTRIKSTGVWVLKGRGSLAWIAPWHYLVLNYWDMSLDTYDGKKEYRDKDRRKWWFFYTAYKHPFCTGVNYLKRRRDGASIDGGVCAWWFAISGKDKRSGIMSFDEPSADAMFEEMVRDPMYRMPAWLIPIHSTSPSSKELTLKTPMTKRTAKNNRIYTENALGGWVKTCATTEKGFDGRKMAYIHFTEAGKLKRINLLKWFSRNKLTLWLGPKRVGFMQIETTCDELESGAAQFKKLYDGGKEVNERGQTKYGLWSCFFPAWDGYEGFVDADGETIKDTPDDKQWAFMQERGQKERIGAMEYQRRQRLLLQDDPTDLQEYIAKEPWTEEEAFNASNSDCHFNLNLLTVAKKTILDAGEETLWKRGNFEWEDGSRRRVKFVPDEENGKFCVAWFPPAAELTNMVGTGRWGWEPLNKKMGVIGLDPFNNAVVSDKKRASKAGMTGYLYFDLKSEQANKGYREAYGKDREGYHPTPSVIFKYKARPATMNIFFEDVLKACWYYGLPLANERQINKIETFMETHECKSFMLTTAEMKGGKDLKPEDFNLYGMPMSEDLAYECIQMVRGFLEGDGLHLREFKYKIFDDIRRMPFLECIEDLMTFRNEKRTEFDWVMSFFQALKAEDGVMDLSNPSLRVVRNVTWLDGPEPEDDYDQMLMDLANLSKKALREKGYLV
jgi:hypothetical protein